VHRVRLLLTPRWIAGHLLAVVGVVGFILLGFWQLDRYSQKKEIRDAVEAAAQEAPVPIEDAAGEDLTYRVMWTTGVYDPSAEVMVLRSQAGVPGHLVVTPLVMEDGTAILVDRGWVPVSENEAPVPGALPPETPVGVTGQIWPVSSGGIPDELPDVMTRIDPAVVAAFTSYPIRDDGYLLLFQQTPATEGDLLRPPERPEVSLGPHLNYAGQWFLFALVVVVGYPILLRRTLKGSTRQQA
jgi:surfeit locus 1 family protein